MLAETLAKAVECAQLKMPIADLSQAEGIADLQIELKGVVELLIRPAEARFEDFRPDEYVDRRVGSGGFVGN